MSNLRLFSARSCPFAHRTRLVLGQKGVPFELVEIDLTQKPSWFKDVSLYGKVPALEHEGQRIVESAIVNEYLEEVFPEPALFPKEPVARARARIWVDFANTRLAPAFGKLLRSESQADRDAGARELSDAFTVLERTALPELSSDGPFFLGAAPSLVDFAFYPWFERLPALEHFRGPAVPPGLERLTAWRAAASALPAVRAIANPPEFYIERYRAYVPAPIAAQ